MVWYELGMNYDVADKFYDVVSSDKWEDEYDLLGLMNN